MVMVRGTGRFYGSSVVRRHGHFAIALENAWAADLIVLLDISKDEQKNIFFVCRGMHQLDDTFMHSKDAILMAKIDH